MIVALSIVLMPVLVSLALAYWRRKRELVAELPSAPPVAVPTRSVPDRLLPGQMPATNGCPSPYVELRGKKGCWLEAAKRPPCGLIYEFEGRCYEPKLVWAPMPSAQDPWRQDER